MLTAKTAVIYARYSSDLQRDRSIDDQITLCKEIALRNGYKIAEVFSDRAKSGASMFERDGLLALMNSAKKRSFQAVISESLSRLSRDQEDTAAIFKRLKFNDITIIDAAGVVSDVHVGVGGIVNSMFLKNLAVSVKRSLNARAKEGLVPGRIAFGLRGTGTKCEREIDPRNSKIVLRVFEEYADGKSLSDIDDDLRREKIVVPNLGEMLRNPIYIGKIVRNVTNSVKNPETGRRLYRPAAIEDRITVDAPQLRIIPQGLWDCVQELRTARSKAKGYHGPRQHKFVNKDQLLLGLLTCGKCGGSMMIGQNNPDGSPRMVCSFGYKKSGCDHRRSYCLKTLQGLVLNGVKEKLTNRKALIELTRAYHQRWAEREKSARADLLKAKAELGRVEVQCDRIISAIAESNAPPKALVAKMDALELTRASLAQKIELIEREGNVIALHPAAIDRFASLMDEVHAALTGDLSIDQLAPFRSVFRNVVERIVVHPTAQRQPYEVTPHTRLSAMMELGPLKTRSTREMLAEQGVSYSKVLQGSPSRTLQNRNSDIVSLGRWRAAA